MKTKRQEPDPMTFTSSKGRSTFSITSEETTNNNYKGLGMHQNYI